MGSAEPALLRNRVSGVAEMVALSRATLGNICDANDEDRTTCASPPCYMHELNPAYTGLEADGRQAEDVKRWRKAERERLISARIAMESGQGRSFGDRISEAPEEVIGDPCGLVVSAYWPFRGEPDLRNLLESVASVAAVAPSR